MRKLKNGSEILTPIVVTTMMSLELLMTRNPAAFYELVQKCRDNTHKMFGNTESVLEELALISRPTGSVHDFVRNIVLSAVVGDDLEMQLGNPVAPIAEVISATAPVASAAVKDSSTQQTAQTESLVRFYIERPVDRFGNTGYPKAIISAKEIKRDGMFGAQLRLIEPEYIAKSWPTVSERSFVGAFIKLPEHFGPARKLTHQEHQAIWQQYLAESDPQVAEREATALKNSPFFNY